MKLEDIIQPLVLFGIGTFVLIVALLSFLIVVSANKMADQMLWLCYENNFENVTLHGDFSGNLDCNQYYLDGYSNGKWTERCSVSPFSTKESCHTLCNIDCAYQNKLNGQVCVC
jgi:hypothetical protein